jgi:hypothetical protein
MTIIRSIYSIWQSGYQVITDLLLQLFVLLLQLGHRLASPLFALLEHGLKLGVLFQHRRLVAVLLFIHARQARVELASLVGCLLGRLRVTDLALE